MEEPGPLPVSMQKPLSSSTGQEDEVERQEKKKNAVWSCVLESMFVEEPRAPNQVQIFRVGQEPHALTLRGFLSAMTMHSKYIEDKLVTSTGTCVPGSSIHVGEQLLVYSTAAHDALLLVWSAINGMRSSTLTGFDDAVMKVYAREWYVAKGAVAHASPSSGIVHAVVDDDARHLPRFPPVTRPCLEDWLHRFAMLQHMRTFMDYFQTELLNVSCSKWLIDLANTCPAPCFDDADQVLSLHPVRRKLIAYMDAYAKRYLPTDICRETQFHRAICFVQSKCVVRTCSERISRENIEAWTDANGLRMMLTPPKINTKCVEHAYNRCDRHMHLHVVCKLITLRILLRKILNVDRIKLGEKTTDDIVLYCVGASLVRVLRLRTTPATDGHEVSTVIRNEPGCASRDDWTTEIAELTETRDDVSVAPATKEQVQREDEQVIRCVTDIVRTRSYQNKHTISTSSNSRSRSNISHILVTDSDTDVDPTITDESVEDR